MIQELPTNNKPVYIVTGFHRSGTSMMMRCLIMGGIKASWETATDRLTHDPNGGYHPNPNGFYHLADESVDPAFYEFYKGQVVKFNWRLLFYLPEGNYKIILMVRPPGEIKRSLETAFPSEYAEIAACDFYDLLIPQISKRFKVIPVNYHDMLKEPQSVLRALDWPIDPAAAAKGVDLNLYRHRERTKTK